MSASYFNLLKYAATGQASPDMTYYDRMRASTLMGSATVQTLTGHPPLTFKADGTPLISWSMIGNGSQQGTPTPDNPVMPEFVGTLDVADWTIPITCGGQIYNIYLSEPLRKIGDYADTVSSDGTVTRKIRRYSFTGSETWTQDGASGGVIRYRCSIPRANVESGFFSLAFISSHSAPLTGYTANTSFLYQSGSGTYFYISVYASDYATADDFKRFVGEQYTGGTPITVWYQRYTAQTETVTAPTIQTAKGSNTLTVDTDLQPSEMTITYKG